MALTCTCGAALPENARFCHQCGKPQREEDLGAGAEIPPAPPPSFPPVALSGAPRPETLGLNFANPVALRVALLCGSISALLNAIPFVSLGCCVWITGSGFVAAYLYGRRTGLLVSTSQGARLGWMTGLLTFAISIVFTALNFALMRGAGSGIREAIRQQMEKMPAQDAATKQVIEFFLSPGGLAVFVLFYLVVGFLGMVSLAMAGGALGAKVMEKDS